MHSSNKMIGYENKQLSQDEPWRIFHIMSEFVCGYEALANIGPAVSVSVQRGLKEETRIIKSQRRQGGCLRKPVMQ